MTRIGFRPEDFAWVRLCRPLEVCPRCGDIVGAWHQHWTNRGKAG